MGPKYDIILLAGLGFLTSGFRAIRSSNRYFSISIFTYFHFFFKIFKMDSHHHVKILMQEVHGIRKPCRPYNQVMVVIQRCSEFRKSS